MARRPTNIQDLGARYWQNSLLGRNGIPLPWNNDEARAQGGTVDAIMAGIAANLESINGQLHYGFLADRIQTATDTELDLAAKDFYGDTLPRLPGELDSAYRLRILAGLFVPKVTKEAFEIGLTRLLGEEPRLIDPWIAGQTSAYDWSYYDVDDPKIRPGIYGDPSLKYQVGLIAQLPPPAIFDSTGVLWGYDIGAAYDSYTGAYSPATAAQFFSANQVDDSIKSIKAAGITVWRKYFYHALVTWIVANSVAMARGNYKLAKSILQFAGPYVVIASGSWNSTYYVPIKTATGFEVDTNTPSPSNSSTVNTVAIPFTVPNSGSIPCTGGDTSCLIATPGGNLTARIAVTPSWNTTLYISQYVGRNLVLRFGTPAPPGGTVSYFFMADTQSAFLPISQGSMSTTVVVAGVTAAPFVTPSWNTQVAVTLANGLLTASFSVPAPTGAFIHWGYVSNGQKSGAASFPVPPSPAGVFLPPVKDVEYPSYDGPNNGTFHGAMAISSAGDFIYCCPYTSGFTESTVLKIDAADGSIVANMDSIFAGTGTQIGDIWLSPDNSKIFVHSFDLFSDTVYLINASDLSVIHAIPVPGGGFSSIVSDDVTTAISGVPASVVVDITAGTTTPLTIPSSIVPMGFKAGSNTNFYCTDNFAVTTIYEYDTSGTLINTFPLTLPGGHPDIEQGFLAHPVSNIIFGQSFDNTTGDITFFAFDPSGPTMLWTSTDPSYFTNGQIAFDPANLAPPWKAYFNGLSFGAPPTAEQDVWAVTDGGVITTSSTIGNFVGYDGIAVLGNAVYTTCQDPNLGVDGAGLVVQTLNKP